MSPLPERRPEPGGTSLGAKPRVWAAMGDDVRKENTRCTRARKQVHECQP